MENSDVFVDGNGANRVAEILIPSSLRETNLKMASKNDVYAYYDWVNEKEVRANSFNKKKIKFEDHKKWFYDQLKYPKKKFTVYFKSKKIVFRSN